MALNTERSPAAPVESPNNDRQIIETWNFESWNAEPWNSEPRNFGPRNFGPRSFGAGTLNPALRLQAIGLQLQAIVNRWWQTLVRITFGLFMGSLITLLALLYAGVPVVGS